MHMTPMPTKTPRRRRSTIRRSTEADLKVIHAWLIDQNARNIPGSFLCNWKLTEDCHRKGKLIVYVDGDSHLPVAYQWGGLIHSGILEVRNDMRGKGIGRRLVEQRISEAYKKDECFLHIQCKPSTSISFWKRMGFQMLDTRDGDNYAYRILVKTHQLPPNADPVSVSIQFYPENRNWTDDVAPLCTAMPVAVRASDNVIHLAERIFCFEPLYPSSQDPVVEIIVEGKLLYREKAKYDDAERLGVTQCRNGFFIDCIFPQP